MSKIIRIGVLFGGKSGEHEVSLLSARSVIDALESTGKYEVVPIGITRSGRWVVRPDALALLSSMTTLQLPGAETASAEERDASAAALRPDSGDAPLVRIEDGNLAPEPLDVVFPVLHGPRGEDGTIQGFLELAGIPYVGCGVAASAVAMDKALAKSILQAEGLPVVDGITVRAHEWNAAPEEVIERAGKIGFPCFVKPANMGSSVGITRATDEAGLRRGLDEAARYDTRIIVERAIDAREIECSVLGNDDPRASVPGEVVPSGEFYDYRAKYLDEASELKIPAPIDEETTRAVQELAVRAFRALDGAGMARVDFLLERDGGRLFVNELNTIPGFTAISMYSKLWEASGLSYTDLVDELVRLAIERHDTRKNLSVTYQPPD